MPNWCNNSLTVTHPDKELMQKFCDGVKNGNLLETLVPLSTGEWDYGTAVDEWGTKWDVSSGEFELDEDGLSGNGWFDTAWGPPLAAYSKLLEMGFSIDAGYSESGMGFVGTWIDGEEEYIDSYYDLFEEENWRDGIDESNYYILDYLDCEYESWLDNRQEEE